MSGRTFGSEYLHWARSKEPARFDLATSEVAHFPLTRLGLSIADLEIDGASHFRYPPLRRAIADKHGVEPERVVTADGTSMANMLAMAALVGPGDTVLVEHPTYEPILAAARFLGADVRRFARTAESGFALEAEAVAAALTTETKLVVVTNLHNPSGALADEAALRAVGALGPHVLVDEVYLDAAFDIAPRSAVHLGPRFVATGSLTKVYGLSGLRCGWILAEPDLAKRIWRLNDLFGVAQAHQAERLACIALDRLDEIAAGTPALLARNRALLAGFLTARDELEWVPTAAGTTAFPRLLRGDAETLYARLRSDHDTSIVPGRWFEMPGHFRIGIARDTATVEAGLRRLGRALDALA